MKRIKSEDLETWQSSPAYKKLNDFLDCLFREICGKKLSQIPEATDKKCLKRILGLLEAVNEAVDEIEPKQLQLSIHNRNLLLGHFS